MARVVIFEKEPWKRSELGQQNNMIYTIRSWGYMKNTLHSIGAGGIEEHPIIERGHQIGAQSSESKESSWNDSPEVAPPAISMGLCFWSWYKRLQAAPPDIFQKSREKQRVSLVILKMCKKNIKQCKRDASIFLRTVSKSYKLTSPAIPKGLGW